ncbi:hypothetical protein B1B_06098 [mine drainage metagenome]|uniref:Antitoxin SocA-like Panacea domain-containing protein n=1 Tax=mine drainage metagenome TaxID=410659 RepID=T1CJE9_9ZZZZ
MVKEITFSPQKALESILYIAAKLDKPTIHEVLKVRYFADKLHLAEYGFLASGDDYVAMRFGPVASNTYNLLKAARGDQSPWLHPIFFAVVKDTLQITSDGYSLKSLRGTDLSQLSIADIECLDAAIKRYGNMSFEERTELSHDAAWQKAWDTASEDDMGQSSMLPMEIAQTLENAAEVLESLRS